MTLPTRLDGLSQTMRVAVVALLLGLSAASALLPETPLRVAKTEHQRKTTDPELYRHIIARVAHGEPYYAAAAAEQRASGFPLRPFVTVRLPTLATLSAWLGNGGTLFALAILSFATILAWIVRLRAEIRGWQAQFAMGLVMMPCLMVVTPVIALFHESWAALLMALSLGLWRPGRWIPSVIAGLAACLFRETALPFLLLMGSAAALERRWREVAGWAMALAAFGLALWFHAGAVAAIGRPGDLASPGWSGLGGWPLFVSAFTSATLLAAAPVWLAKLLIPLSLVGWGIWRHPLALRVAGLCVGYAALLMLFARPDTWYWALMPAPLLLAGLAFVPSLFKAWRPAEIAAKPPA